MTTQPAPMAPATPQQVLDFWFGPADDPGHTRPRAAWFRKDEAFDAQVREHFGPTLAAALDGRLAHWADDPAALPLHALALVIVLDQFTRNAFRGQPRAFAGDAQALSVAQRLVASGADRRLTGVQRQFVYLPFEHAEDLAMQRQSVALFTALAADEPMLADLVDWAERHLVIVERFGRFPHRNALLGRASTAEEEAFLATPGSSF